MVTKNHSTLIALATVVCLFPVFAAIALIRVADYRDSQVQIAKSVLADVAEVVDESLSEKRRLLGIFANQYSDTLLAITQDPDDLALQGRLEAQLEHYFPDYFAYSITTTQGVPLIDDFDGRIGEICLDDLRDFVASGVQRPRIHPNAEAYHFDLVSRWRSGLREGLLVASFRPRMLAEIIRATQPPGHQLMLVLKEYDNLIEITELGDRLEISGRDDFRMSQDELSRVLHERQLPGTRWHIVDLQQADALAGIYSQTYRQMGVIYVLFVAAIAVLWRFLRRYELQRERLTETLTAKNRELEEENRLALNVYKRITKRNNQYVQNLKVHESSMSTFSGDIQFSYGSDQNRFYFLFGDFTGHGLGAALGAIPLADAFFKCAREQSSLGAMFRVCNDRLVDVMPTERFCCAILLMWDRAEGTLSLCNAGIPDAFLVGEGGRIEHTFHSTVPPLGVAGFADVEVTTLGLSKARYLVGYTDGVSEAMNADKEFFGEHRVVECIQLSEPEALFDSLVQALTQFTGSESQTDDISLFQLSFDA